MARKITVDASSAFQRGVKFKHANMEVQVRPWQEGAGDWVILLLYGNPIARYPVVGGWSRLQICDGNHPTVTTKDRLNGLPGVRVHQRKGQWYLNDEAWDGSWAVVGEHIAVKHTGGPNWEVYYPHSMRRDPVGFTSRAAATAFAEVESANLGVPL